MEYFNLVLKAFSAALGWFGAVLTRDNWLFSNYLGLIFASVAVNLLLLPFLRGVSDGYIYGAGSDWARNSRRSKKNSGSASKKASSGSASKKKA